MSLGSSNLKFVTKDLLHEIALVLANNVQSCVILQGKA